MNRTLHRAILLSLALHGMVLFGWSVERITARREAPSPPLEARLVEPPAPPAAPPPSPPPKAEPAKPATPPAVKKASPRPKPPPVATKPAPEPAPPAPPEVAAEREPLPAPPAVAKIETAPAAPAAPGAEQLEAMTREQYRLAVIDAARRHNRYPPLARENNWEGEVRVRLDIGADGRVNLAVEKSSGHPVLDRQAVDMFRRAQAQVAMPPSLRGKALSLELRAIYNLKDQVSG